MLYDRRMARELYLKMHTRYLRLRCCWNWSSFLLLWKVYIIVNKDLVVLGWFYANSIMFAFAAFLWYFDFPSFTLERLCLTSPPTVGYILLILTIAAWFQIRGFDLISAIGPRGRRRVKPLPSWLQSKLMECRWLLLSN